MKILDDRKFCLEITISCVKNFVEIEIMSFKLSMSVFLALRYNIEKFRYFYLHKMCHMTYHF